MTEELIEVPVGPLGDYLRKCPSCKVRRKWGYDFTYYGNRFMYCKFCNGEIPLTGIEVDFTTAFRKHFDAILTGLKK